MAPWSASHARCDYSCILPWNVLQVCQHVPSSEGCYQPYQASEGEGQGNQQQGETQRKEEKDRIFLRNQESKHPHFSTLLKHFVCWDIYSLLLHSPPPVPGECRRYLRPLVSAAAVAGPGNCLWLLDRRISDYCQVKIILCV